MKTLALSDCLIRLDKTGKALSFDRPPCVVIVGAPEVASTALQTIRCLGRMSVPVVAISAQRMPPSFASRYATVCLRCPDQKQSPDQFLRFLVELGRRISPRPALQFCSDYEVMLISNQAELLKPLYDGIFLQPKALRVSIDKWEMINAARAAGSDVPLTVLLQSEADLPAVANFQMPAIIKPISRFKFSQNQLSTNALFEDLFSAKAVRAATQADLLECVRRALESHLFVLVQEEIPGDVRCLHDVCVYADQHSNVVADFFARKMRQTPPDSGSATVAMSMPPVPELARFARAFVKQTGFQGIAEFELKLDPRDGRYKFIEVNPRSWTWVCLPEAEGVNFPYIQYLEVTGQPISPVVGIGTETKWIDLLADWRYYWHYGRRGRDCEQLSLREWLHVFRGRREFAYSTPDDRLPGVVKFAYFLVDLLRRAIKKLGRLLRVKAARLNNIGARGQNNHQS